MSDSDSNGDSNAYADIYASAYDHAYADYYCYSGADIDAITGTNGTGYIAVSG